MKALLLCHVPAAAFDQPMPAEAEAEMHRAMHDYNQQLMQAGVLLGATHLAPHKEGLWVQAVDGEIRVRPAPEQAASATVVGGYYLLDVASAAEAADWAARCPVAHFGALEVRIVAYAPC